MGFYVEIICLSNCFVLIENGWKQFLLQMVFDSNLIIEEERVEMLNQFVFFIVVLLIVLWNDWMILIKGVVVIYQLDVMYLNFMDWLIFFQIQMCDENIGESMIMQFCIILIG